MPTFSYTARDTAGTSKQGYASAATSNELRETLRSKQLFLTAFKETSSKGGESDILDVTASSERTKKRRKAKLGDMVVMSRQLATMVGAGLPIVEALYAVAAQTDNAGLSQTLAEVRLDVLSGSTLSESMARHPKMFNEMYISLVQAGEVGGVLEETLETAAVQFDKEAELREKIKSAMVYPIIVVMASVAVVAFMLVFIVPVFANVYDQFNAKLPPVTMSLVVVSRIVRSYWYIVLSLIVLAWYSCKRFNQTPNGRRFFDGLKFKLPLIGKLNRKIAVARFTRTLAGLVRAGVPILRGLTISANTSGNVLIIEAIRKVVEFVKEGATISVPLEQTGEFPPMVTKMIAAGEQSGDLDHMLNEITRFYDRDIEYQVGRLMRIMEPLMTIFVGGVVLFILLALYMPVFNLTQVIRK
jgi:type IV pilus assembly protein PilC